MLHFIRASKLDFMKLAKPAFIISWLLILIGIGYGFTRGKSASASISWAAMPLLLLLRRKCRKTNCLGAGESRDQRPANSISKTSWRRR